MLQYSGFFGMEVLLVLMVVVVWFVLFYFGLVFNFHYLITSSR